MDRIRILIASELAEYRKELNDILGEEPDFLVMGEAVGFDNALKKTEHLIPDILILDINESVQEGMDTTERITKANPNIGVIIIAANPDSMNVKQALHAGAGDFFAKPELKAAELTDAIRRLHETQSIRAAHFGTLKSGDRDSKYRPPQVVSIFGAKGGSGKTTLAVNIAAAIVRDTKRKVVLVDMNLQFGDVDSYLNLKPRRTIAEFVQERSQWDVELLNTYLIPHDSGVKVLAAPLKPEDADLVNAAHMEKIIKLLRNSFDYIIIDFPQYLSDTILSVLDFSNQIILVLPLELPAVKNIKLCLNLLEALNHTGKIKLVVNRASRMFGVDSQDIEKKIDFYKAEEIPSEGNTVVNATNKGIPFVISSPKAPVSRAVHRVAQLIINDAGYQTDLKAGKKAAAKSPIINKFFKR